MLGNKELKLQDVRKSGEVTEMLDLQSPDGTHGPKLQVRLRFEAQTAAPGTSSSAPAGDLLVCEFAAGRKAAPVLPGRLLLLTRRCGLPTGLGLSFDRNSVPALAVREVDGTALAASFPELVPGCVLQTVQGVAVSQMGYDDVLALIKESRPAGPTTLGFSRPAVEEDEL